MLPYLIAVVKRYLSGISEFPFRWKPIYHHMISLAVFLIRSQQKALGKTLSTPLGIENCHVKHPALPDDEIHPRRANRRYPLCPGKV